MIPARSARVEAVWTRSRDTGNTTRDNACAGSYQENWCSLLACVPSLWLEKRFGESDEAVSFVTAPRKVDPSTFVPPRGASPLGKPKTGHSAQHSTVLESRVNRALWSEALLFTDDEAMKQATIAFDALPLGSPVKFDRNRRVLQLVFAQTEQLLKRTQAPTAQPNIHEREDVITSGNACQSLAACSSRCAAGYLPRAGLTNGSVQVIAEGTLVTARKAKAAGDRVRALRVGSAKNPGGDAKRGESAGGRAASSNGHVHQSRRRTATTMLSSGHPSTHRR